MHLFKFGIYSLANFSKIGSELQWFHRVFSCIFIKKNVLVLQLSESQEYKNKIYNACINNNRYYVEHQMFTCHRKNHNVLSNVIWVVLQLVIQYVTFFMLLLLQIKGMYYLMGLVFEKKFNIHN